MHASLLATLGLAATCCAPIARAADAVIDFEQLTPGLYFPADSFEQSGYTLTVVDNFAQVDTAASILVPPTGDATQLYFQAGDGGLEISRNDGVSFSLNGLSAAFVPMVPAVGEESALVALGTHPDGTYDVGVFSFASMVDGAYPFASYGAPDGFTDLSDLLLFGCANGVGGICYQANQGNGQFALDDIRLSTAEVLPAVPEPAQTWLLTIGLVCLAVFSRRRRVDATSAGV